MTNPSSTQTPTGKRCPACGAAASGKFCQECGSALAAMACGSCEATLPVAARFCNECGTPVKARGATVPPDLATAAAAAGAGPSLATALPWGIAAIALVAAVAFFSGRGMGGDAGGTIAAGGAGGFAPGAAPFAGGVGGAAPDISNMSPRERAGRLYDRIMRYAEEGKRDSLEFFAPMALASFDLLGADLDLDARYDYGRVAIEAGELGVAAAQADTILMTSPTHLLGLSLAARTAERQGDAAAAARSWQAFLAARETELARNLPEYQAHAGDIEAGTRLAQGAG